MNLSEKEIMLLESQGILVVFGESDSLGVRLNLNGEVARFKKINLLNSNHSEFMSADTLLALIDRKLKASISIVNAYNSSHSLPLICYENLDDLDPALLAILNYESKSDIGNSVSDENELLNELL